MKVRICSLAKKHHDESPRQFAHVFHKRDTICVTPEFYELPRGYRLGIILHEMGHVILGKKRHSEEDADEAIWEAAESRIFRKTYRGMENLEWIRPIDYGTALYFLRQHITDK